MQEESGIAESPPPNEAEVLELLRTPKLSIKNLDPATKEKIRKYILWKHIEQGVSLSDIAKLIGSKTSGYTSWLTRQLGIQPRPFEEARLEGIHKKVRKHERKPFDGTDEDKAYLLGLLHGDLHASRPWKDAVRISTSTTHPAMAELFISLFEKYGHVYLHPRYKKETDSYEWNLSANLDSSFEFMFMSHAECWNWVSMEDSRILSYLAGLFDAEGTIGVHPNALNISLSVAYFNTNLELMNQVCAWLSRIGYHPLPPYLQKPKGTRSSGFKIVIKKDYWRVLVATFEESHALLAQLDFRHRERITKKTLGLSVHKGERWISVVDRVEEIRKAIRIERDLFVSEAERVYLSTHYNPRDKRSSPT